MPPGLAPAGTPGPGHSLTVRFILFATFVLGSAMSAQEPVAPTDAATGPPRGDFAGPYNLLQSFELGDRFLSITGNEDAYRSHINYGNGLRLLSSSFAMYSKDGKNRWLDRLTINTQGLGNDPYESARLHAESRWYDYDLRWRLSDYFNPGLGFAQDLHAQDTRRTIQDHDLVIFPRGRFRILAGYSRFTQSGAALTTNVLQGFTGSPLFQDVRRLDNEYRLGFEWVGEGTRISLLRSWENYSENSPASNIAPSASTPADAANAFQSAEPYHAKTPGWRLIALHEFGKRFSVNARFTYAGTRGRVNLDESLYGTPTLSQPIYQVTVAGNATRPVTTASLNLTFTPSERLTLTNQTFFDQTRMNGNSVYGELNNSTLVFQQIDFQFIGIRRTGNQTDMVFRVLPWLDVTGGCHVDTRTIGSARNPLPNATPGTERDEQSNTQQAGVAGLRFRFAKRFSLLLNAEKGTNDDPVYPVSDKSYHALNGRLQYKTKTLRLAASVRESYNFNSDALSTFSARGRVVSAEGSWTPRAWFAVDAVYSKLHTGTTGGLAYFVANSLVTGTESIYVSNIHTGSLWLRLSPGKYATIRLGYSRVQDVGDGRAQSSAGLGLSTGAFAAAQTLPLTYSSPQLQLTMPIGTRLRWNAGWQMYRYGEQFESLRNYRAQTGFTSLLWSF
jgi:hypothetical protein